MVLIYCIEDINDLKYIGSTSTTLGKRLSVHKYEKKSGTRGKCSSAKLNLYNCIIYVLEECPEEDRKTREKYWINKLDCVNTLKLNGRDLVSQKEYNRIRYLKLKSILII